MAVLIIFRELPGVDRIESEQMIADKFHQEMSADRADDVSRTIFGITHTDTYCAVPRWFVEGFDNADEWAIEETRRRKADEWDKDDDMNGLVETSIDNDAANDLDDVDEDDDDNFDDDESEESPERFQIYRQISDWEERMAVDVPLKDDYDLMNYARTFGFDFSDGRGNPLLVTKFFFRQALAASRGVAGHLPDVSEMDSQVWGEKLAEEARKYKKVRR